MTTDSRNCRDLACSHRQLFLESATPLDSYLLRSFFILFAKYDFPLTLIFRPDSLLWKLGNLSAASGMVSTLVFKYNLVVIPQWFLPHRDWYCSKCLAEMNLYSLSLLLPTSILAWRFKKICCADLGSHGTSSLTKIFLLRARANYHSGHLAALSRNHKVCSPHREGYHTRAHEASRYSILAVALKFLRFRKTTRRFGSRDNESLIESLWQSLTH